MTSRIRRVRLRGILDLRGQVTPEAEVSLLGDFVGTASCPVAIAPGRREKTRAKSLAVGALDPAHPLTDVIGELEGKNVSTQNDFDAVLADLQVASRAGADVTLSLSLAFGRACAQANGQSLFRYMCGLSNVRPAMPHPLVNVFSGGIHGDRSHLPFQQIMVIPEFGSIEDDVRAALTIYELIERRMADKGLILGYSASSGLMVGQPYEALLDELSQQISALGMSSNVSIGADVAAEHLKLADGRYEFSGRLLSGEELASIHHDLIARYPIRFLEDPFDPDDVDLWRSFTSAVADRSWVIGDDLFATNADYISKGLASGILLKMNQVGTLTATLRAAEAARNAEMILCISHRSGETEDAAMCDLAVAVGARFIKVGGPRRGDRTAKYNQLIRLAEELPDRSATLPSERPRGFEGREEATWTTSA